MVDGYNASYASAELAEVTIDIVVGVLATAFQFITIITIIFLATWVMNTLRGQ